MNFYSLSYVCEKEGVGKEVDETISALPKRGQGRLLTIDGYPVCEGYGMFAKGMHLSIFYCLCLVEETLVHIAEERVMEERLRPLVGGGFQDLY